MFEYLTELMQDAADNSWLEAKDAHAVLLHCMQDGVLNWSDGRKNYARSFVSNGGP